MYVLIHIIIKSINYPLYCGAWGNDGRSVMGEPAHFRSIEVKVMVV
jgi:hypothetical protein